MDGNVLDSVTVIKLLKTYEYRRAWSIPKGQTELKRVVRKIDPKQQEEIDNYYKLKHRPKSPRLWENITLDLSPLAKRTDLSQLEGKAIVLIFWTDSRSSNIYSEVNEVIANYIGQNKFEVFAVTHLPYDVAATVLKRSPILNAHQIISVPSVTDFYQTEDMPVIVVTNAQHQITYTMTNNVDITPRMLNNLLKAL
jgi:hypothetical protein